MTITIGYVRVVVGVDFGGREGLCLVGAAASALAATRAGLFVGTLPVKGGKASSRASSRASPPRAPCLPASTASRRWRADDVARACPAECWFSPVKLVCDMFNRLYFFEDLGPFRRSRRRARPDGPGVCRRRHADAGRSRYEHL